MADKIDRVRITIGLSQDLVSRVDDFAKSMGISRPGAISVLLNQAFEYKNAVDSLPQMIGAIGDLKELSDKNEA